MVNSPQTLHRRAPTSSASAAAAGASYSARLLANVRGYPAEAPLAAGPGNVARKPRRAEADRAAPEPKFYSRATKPNKKDGAHPLRKSRGFAVVGERETYPRKDLENLRRGHANHVLSQEAQALRHKERCSDSCRCSQSSTGTSSTGDETSSCSGYSSSSSSSGTPTEKHGGVLFQRDKSTNFRAENTAPAASPRRRRSVHAVKQERNYRISPNNPWRKHLPVPGSEAGVITSGVTVTCNSSTTPSQATTQAPVSGSKVASSGEAERNQPQQQPLPQTAPLPEPSRHPQQKEQPSQQPQHQQQQQQQQQQRKGNKQAHAPFLFELSMDDQQLSAEVACAYYTQTFPIDLVLHSSLMDIYQAADEVLSEHAVQAAQQMEEIKRKATEEWLKSRTEEERKQYMSRLS